MSDRFTQRVKLITGEVTKFLRQFTIPNQLDTPELQLERIGNIAEEVNSIIPGQADDNQISALFLEMKKQIMRTYRGSSWPSVALFVESMKEVEKQRRTGEAVKRIGSDEPFDNRFGDKSKLTSDDLKVLGEACENYRKWLRSPNMRALHDHALSFLKYWREDISEFENG